MKHKKSLALILAIFTLLSAILCCPITASAKGEKHNPYYYSSSAPTRALYYKSSGVMKGSDVKWLQAALNVLNNANIDIDGSFGKGTKSAVSNFQSRNGLSADGSCGNATRAKIITLLYNKGYIAPGKYIIETKLTSGSAMDLSGNNTSNGTNIHLYQKNGSSAQIFNVAVNGKYGWYSIRHASSGKSIDVAGGSSSSGTNVQLYQWNGTDAQLWRFVNAGSGYFYIQNKLGCYLDVSGGRTANGTNIQVYSFNGSNAQKWKFVSTSGATSTSTSKYNLVWPVSANSGYKVSSRLGTRTDPITGSQASHKGIDIAAPSGTNIYATANGVVVDVGNDINGKNQRGYYICIYHKELDLYSVYQHMKSSAIVSKGATVTAGQKIGYVGTTGKSTGNHLHFELVVASSVDSKHKNINCAWSSNAKLINGIQTNPDINYTFK